MSQSIHTTRVLATAQSAQLMEHDKWRKEIPFISFPSDWEIQISPSNYGAVSRFRVKKGTAQVSIYLDCYDILGCYGSPYWEVYPIGDGVDRCAMNDTDELLKLIAESIKEQTP